MSGFDEFDDRELAERLGRASGAFPDENVAYATVLRGVRRARRRRAAAGSTMAAALIVAVVFVGVALRGRGGETRLATVPSTSAAAAPSTTPAATAGTTSTSSTTSTSTTTSTTSSTTTTTIEPSTVAPDDPAPTVDTVPASADPQATAAPAKTAAPTTTRRRSTTTTVAAGGGEPSPTSAPPAETPVPTTAAPVTVQTFGGDGGTITVRSDGTTLKIVGIDATGGYTVDVHDSTGRRVEVQFSSRRHRTTVRVDLRNGRMTPTVSESDSGGSPGDGFDDGAGQRSGPPDSTP